MASDGQKALIIDVSLESFEEDRALAEDIINTAQRFSSYGQHEQAMNCMIGLILAQLFDIAMLKADYRYGYESRNRRFDA